MSAAAARKEYSYEDSNVAIATQPTRPSSRASSRRDGLRRDGYRPVNSRPSLNGSAVRAPRELLLDEALIREPLRVREPLRTPLRDIAQEFEAHVHPESIEQAASQRVARNRTRRAHRPVAVSFTTILFGSVVFAQLLGLLYVKSLATGAAHRSIELGDESRGEIGKVNEAIAQTQGKIARLSSPSQIEHWANARHWTVASPAQFDDLSRFAGNAKPSDDVSTRIASTNEVPSGEVAVNGH